MNVEEQLSRLLAAADALRPLHEDDPKRAPLAGLINEINRLRAIEADRKRDEWLELVKAANAPGSDGLTEALRALSDERDHAQAAEHEAEFAQIAAQTVVKRGPGRPRKQVTA